MTALNHLFKHGARVEIPDRTADSNDWIESNEITERAEESSLPPDSEALKTVRVWFNRKNAQVRLLTNDWRKRGRHGEEWKVYYPLPVDEKPGGTLPQDGGAIREFDSKEKALEFAESWMSEHPDVAPGKMQYSID